MAVLGNPVHRLGARKWGGWKPDRPKASKDWHVDKLLGGPRAVMPVSPSCDPAYFPMMKNQLSLGSCTGESLCLALEEEVIRTMAEAGEDVTSPWWLKWQGLSGLAAYYFAREAQGSTKDDSGSEIRTCIDGARRNGIPNESSWPYRPAWYRIKPNAKAMKTAPWHNLDEIETYRCDGAGGSREGTLTNILRVLEAKRPVNFGFACPKDWGDYDETGRIPLPNGAYSGGHAMTSFMADTDAKVLIGPNTWGDKIGAPQPKGSRIVTRGGRGWWIKPFQYFLDGDADDAWAIVLRRPGAKRESNNG